MLGKLIKHDLKATSRVIPFIYLSIAVLGLVGFIGLWMRKEAIGFIACFIMMFAGLGAYVATLILLAVRFHKSMFGREGYLTLTLPVSTGQLLLSKSISSLVWIFSSFIVMFGSIFLSISIMFNHLDTLEPGVGAMLNETFSPLYGQGTVLFLISAVVSSLYFIASIFFSFSLGNSGIFSNQGAWLGVLLYLGIDLVANIIGSIITFFMPLSMVIGKDGISFTTQSMGQAMIDEIFAGVEPTTFTIGIGSYIYEIALIVLFFVFANKLLKRKLCLK